MSHNRKKECNYTSSFSNDGKIIVAAVCNEVQITKGASSNFNNDNTDEVNTYMVVDCMN